MPRMMSWKEIFEALKNLGKPKPKPEPLPPTPEPEPLPPVPPKPDPPRPPDEEPDVDPAFKETKAFHHINRWAWGHGKKEHGKGWALVRCPGAETPLKVTVQKPGEPQIRMRLHGTDPDQWGRDREVWTDYDWTTKQTVGGSGIIRMWLRNNVRLKITVPDSNAKFHKGNCWKKR